MIDPQRQRGAPQLKLAQQARVDGHVGCVRQRARRGLDGFAEPGDAGVRAALAHALVDGDLERAGALAASELGDGGVELVFLAAAVGVDGSLGFGATEIDAVHPQVLAPQPAPLADAVQGADVHGQRERPRDLHRLKQPPQPRGVGQPAGVDDLLEVPADPQVTVI